MVACRLQQLLRGFGHGEPLCICFYADFEQHADIPEPQRLALIFKRHALDAGHVVLAQAHVPFMCCLP